VLPESLIEMSNGDGVAQPLRARDKATTKLRDLYVEFAPEAGRLAYLLVGDADAAQDIAQEAFVRVGPRLRWMRDPVKAKFYLRTTVINLCRAHWRRREREHPHRDMDPWSPIQQDHGPRVDQRGEMVAALQRLPVRQRTALVLRYYEDLSEHQTADVLGCPVGTVKSSVSRALQTLREDFGGKHHG
jgi:RNA polymerase sigma-70 factor (sigma-E family)